MKAFSAGAEIEFLLLFLRLVLKGVGGRGRAERGKPKGKVKKRRYSCNVQLFLAFQAEKITEVNENVVVIHSSMTSVSVLQKSSVLLLGLTGAYALPKHSGVVTVAWFQQILVYMNGLSNVDKYLREGSRGWS